MPDRPAAAEPRKKVLIVDNEESIVRMLSVFMARCGFDVDSAENGKDGLRKLREEVWDVVVTDRTMPGMSGEELAIHVRALAQDLPIILITGIPTAVNRPELFSAVISKPFSFGDVATAIDSALRRGG